MAMALLVRASNGFRTNLKQWANRKRTLSEKQASEVDYIYLKNKQAAFKNYFLKSGLPW
jgi:hypothetical protein